MRRFRPSFGSHPIRRAGGWFTAAALGLALLLGGCSAADPPADVYPTGTASDTSTAASSSASGTTTGVTTQPSGSAADSTGSTGSTSGTTTAADATRTTSVAGTTRTTSAPTTKPSDQPVGPAVTGEFRGMWVSYIELNSLLDGKSAAAAQAALDEVMDRCVSYGMNAVIFHARANSDAYYQSQIFQPAAAVKDLIAGGFDPLAYAVRAAHARGLQLHAWINPYRIGRNQSYTVSGYEDDTFTKPDTSGNTAWYYLPTSQRAQKLILDGIREVLTYGVDGVQFDDYFYPTAKMSAGLETFEQEGYQASGGKLSVGDWRRAAVDSLVAAVHVLTKNKGIVFGISPSHDVAKTRDQMYADVKKWMASPGYVDYICPQIYFGFEHGSAPFDKTTDEWLTYPRHSGVKLYVGLAIYKSGAEDPYAGSGKREWIEHKDIIKRQVEYLRTKSQVDGALFYSYSYFQSAKKETENLLPLLTG